MATRLSVDYKFFKNKSQELQDYISNNLLYDFEFISNYLDSIESSDQSSCIEDLKAQWINCSQPLQYGQHLKGKLVLFDFFTYCCINCLHVLPTLREIERVHSVKDGLVVIGVHSAKFVNERDTSNIEHAAERYSITHPIINDHELTLWNMFSISCWPTFLLVSPTGRMLYVMIGEILVNKIPQLVDHVLRYYRGKSLILPHELPILKGSVATHSFLKYPGKIHVNSESGHIYISDTGHHRIVVIQSDTSSIISIIGSGRIGLRDGPIAQAEFNSPQGLASKGSMLYIADTENHAIRQVDLERGVVSTLCGTGKLGLDKEGGGVYKEQEISSPWDLEIGGDKSQLLFVAMAGTHQIWILFLTDSLWLKGTSYKAGTMLRFAGTGDEANRNNSYPHRACFAQPSGISINRSGGLLYIADSESGCVRSLSLKDGAVKGVVGGGLDPLDLFSYGDIDGEGRDVRLQHPMAVAYNLKNNSVFVADAYNHKIKVISIVDKSCITLTGNGKAGCVDEMLKSAQFYEPSGLALDSVRQILYVADTNNHTVRAIDLIAGNVSTLSLENTVYSKLEGADGSFDVKVGNTCSLIIVMNFSESLKVNPKSSWEIVVPLQSSSYVSAPVMKGKISLDSTSKLLLVYSHADNPADIQVFIHLYLEYCEGVLCKISQKFYSVSFLFDDHCTELEQSLSISVNELS
ncbi:NHL repeat-containing protein 2 [Oopsacas minuta]|uniref:NHL repeat-containing protein 2 n=1 Tax=Oopsacas minuta TaxID=111878 RepID=A0AAV7JD99_9METZ|nr:NHL repeat-containing protein 2 [Oopsacas minuta]